MNNFKIDILLIAMTVLLLAGTASATTYSVNISGGGDYRSIQTAIDYASTGDTILVHSGTYYAPIHVYKQLILQGIDTGNGSPVIDNIPDGSAFRVNNIVISANGVTLEGFKVLNAFGSIWGRGTGIRIVSSNNVIRNNIVYDNAYYGIYLNMGDNNTLLDNTIMNNHVGIALLGGRHTLENNIVSNNTHRGIVIYASTNSIHNNIFNNTNNIDRYNIEITSSTNTWNITKTKGTNIMGGSYLGGNFWGKPDGTGYSQTCKDADGKGICNKRYVIDSNNIDHLPLTYTTIKK